MKELFPTIQAWLSEHKPFAIATVIKTWGSSPRPVGSLLIVSNKKEMAGSVSGGCVEGAVIRAALPLIENGGADILNFGVSNEEAWSVGLTCGGKVDVFVELFVAFSGQSGEKGVWAALKDCLTSDLPFVLLTKLAKGGTSHHLVLPDGQSHGLPLSDGLLESALKAYTERKSQVLEEGGESYFAFVSPPKSQMLIIGAAHITAHLVQLANMHGFETTVIDPRGVFANKTQFPHPPDKLLVEYPSGVLRQFKLDAYTYAVILSHDPKIDDNALHVLLKSEVAYIGALGSRRTHAKRIARLQEAGFTEREIARVHAPVGMDIHAKTPAEIALSVMGEVIKEKNKYL